MASNAYTLYVCTQYEMFRRHQTHIQTTRTRVFPVERELTEWHHTLQGSVASGVQSTKKIFHTVSIQTNENLIFAGHNFIPHSNVSGVLRKLKKKNQLNTVSANIIIQLLLKRGRTERVRYSVPAERVNISGDQTHGYINPSKAPSLYRHLSVLTETGFKIFLSSIKLTYRV
jgi:hypothetical protein